MSAGTIFDLRAPFWASVFWLVRFGIAALIAWLLLGLIGIGAILGLSPTTRTPTW